MNAKRSSTWILNSVLAGLSPAIPASSGVLEKSGVLASLSRKRSRVQIPYAPLSLRMWPIGIGASLLKKSKWVRFLPSAFCARSFDGEAQVS